SNEDGDPAGDVIALIRLSTESFNHNDAPNLLKFDDFRKGQLEPIADNHSFNTEKSFRSIRAGNTILHQPSDNEKLKSVSKDTFSYPAQVSISESIPRRELERKGTQRTLDSKKLPILSPRPTSHPQTTRPSKTRLKLYECLLNCNRFTSQCHSMVNRGNIQEGFVCLQASTLCRNECRLREMIVKTKVKTVI
uniref:Uncharacterized protein n=1 Tax=Clytia hemisphaerica TaxID=252671 RepID=A0A7M5VH33_9CNID